MSSEDDLSEDEDEDTDDESPKRKRRRSGSDDGRGSKRQRRQRDEAAEGATRLSREQRMEYRDVIRDHYNSGTHHGQSAAGVIYLLSIELGRADNELLWQVLSNLQTCDSFSHMVTFIPTG